MRFKNAHRAFYDTNDCVGPPFLCSIFFQSRIRPKIYCGSKKPKSKLGSLPSNGRLSEWIQRKSFCYKHTLSLCYVVTQIINEGGRHECLTPPVIAAALN